MSDVGHALEVLAEFRWLGEKYRSLAVAAHSGQLFQREMNEPRAQASGAFAFASTSLACPAGRPTKGDEAQPAMFFNPLSLRECAARCFGLNAPRRQ
jgi:hypothetical protein